MDRQPAETTSLTICLACGRPFVSPVQWEAIGETGWWMFLRCAECGTAREVTVSNAVADRYDDEIAAGMKAIGREAKRLERERMAEEAEAFIAALNRGLIEPADFAR